MIGKDAFEEDLDLDTSFAPDVAPTCGPGTTFFYAFRVKDASGHFDAPLATPLESRRIAVGSGVSSSPRISIGLDPDDDVIYINTSEGEILTLEPPLRTDNQSLVYWRQIY